MIIKRNTLAFGLGFFFLSCLVKGLLASGQAPIPAAVWLDAGHGGQDQGVQALGFKEAAFSLDLAKRIAARLASRGIKCDLSRQADVNLSITARVLSANLSHAAAAVSLHANFSFSKASKGVRVFVPTQAGQHLSLSDPKGGPSLSLVRWNQSQALNIESSKRLGQLIAEELEAGQAAKRGVQALPLALFKGMVPPAAVVECGFVSDPEELAGFKDEKQLQDLAEKISWGILRFLRER